MKNILAENMLRFGSKNLTESDIKKLQRLTEVATPVDATAVQTALDNLNTLLPSLPLSEKFKKKYPESGTIKYMNGPYYLYLSVGSAKTLGWATQPQSFKIGNEWVTTPDYMLGLYKMDPAELYTNITRPAIYGNGSSGILGLKKHKEDLQEFVDGLVRDKYIDSDNSSAAYTIINNTFTALDTLATAMDNLVTSWPDGKVVKMASPAGSTGKYTITLYDPTDPEVRLTSSGELESDAKAGRN